MQINAWHAQCGGDAYVKQVMATSNDRGAAWSHSRCKRCVDFSPSWCLTGMVDQAFHFSALVFVSGYLLFAAGLAIVYFTQW